MGIGSTLGKLLLDLIFGKGSYQKVKSEVERDMKNSPFFNEMKRRAEIVDNKEFKMWRQSLRDEEQREREKLSQEEKEELDSLKEEQIEKGGEKACGEVSTKHEKDEDEADLGEKYISAYRINLSTLADIYKEFTQSTSDIKERKISMSAYKILVKKHIGSINACNRLYLELKPPKRFKKVNDLLGKNFEHLLKRNSYLQDFIDTQDIKKMAIYLGQAADENYSANIYAAKAANKMYKLIEK